MKDSHFLTQNFKERPLQIWSTDSVENNDAKLSKANNQCRQRLKLKSFSSNKLGELGLTAYQSGNINEAKRLLTEAIEKSPENSVNYFRLGNIHQDQSDFDEAIICYQNAIEQDTKFLPPLVNLGNLHLENQNYEQAIVVSLLAIEKEPKCLEALSNLGQAYLKLGRLAKASEIFRKTIEYFPKNLEFKNNYGVVQQMMGNIDSAIEVFKSVLKSHPNSQPTERNLKIAVLNSSNWENQELFNLQKSIGEKYVKTFNLKKLFQNHNFSTQRNLRIGYLTSDFCDHPVGYNLFPLIKHHNRESIEIYLYSCVEIQDLITKKFFNIGHRWRDIKSDTDQQVAEIIKRDKIDIIVYLAGRFNKNRPEIAAYRPAPLQISFHDCGTTGIDAIDYWLTDNDLHPKETEEKFVEKLYRLPQFYQFTIPSHTPHVAPPPLLHNHHVTFGSFNKPEKINQEVIKVWSVLLRQIPESKLLMKYRNFFSDEGVKSLWIKKFKKYGIDEKQLIFLASDDQQGDHLALYSQIDIALDPFPFNGATTTFEALLMGVPVIALAGNRFVDRVSGTLLKQTKLSQFLAFSKSEYLQIALNLTGKTDKLILLRKDIRKMLLNSALCNGAVYARQVEEAYKIMWRQRCKESL